MNTKTILPGPFSIVVRTAIWALAAMGGTIAGASGLQDVSLPPISPSPQAITIDGKVDDWRAVGGYVLDLRAGVEDPLVGDHHGWKTAA